MSRKPTPEPDCPCIRCTRQWYAGRDSECAEYCRAYLKWHKATKRTSNKEPSHAN